MWLSGNSTSDFTINDFSWQTFKRRYKIVVFSHCSAVTGIRYVSLDVQYIDGGKGEIWHRTATLLSGGSVEKNKVKLSRKYNQSLSEVRQTYRAG